MKAFKEVSDQLIDNGAQILILGCTELSVIRRTESLGDKYIDPLLVLARECIVSCDRKLKVE